jgi:predicted pyridoxine 5'-phosphate oxidase superfamily flavin-nucleotide-binding protein
MHAKQHFASDLAFTPGVKAIQSRKGSRAAYARMESQGGWATAITDELGGFIARQTSVFLATANAQGQPYIQHRGGPPGFLQVLDEHTIGFADFNGNRQFISSGNLAENPQAHLFMIDYATRQRIKVWGTARVVEDDRELIERLMPANYKAKSEQALLFTVATWDANCPQHIPQRFEASDVAEALSSRDQKIAELEAEIIRLNSGHANMPPGKQAPEAAPPLPT